MFLYNKREQLHIGSMDSQIIDDYASDSDDTL